MDAYLDCINQAKEISKKIHSLKNMEGNIENKFFIEFPNISNLHYKNSILILGLNPSGLGEREPNLFGYIPDIESLTELSSKLHLQARKFTYERYFKAYIELFKKLNYNPIWYNRNVLKEIFDNHSEKWNLKEDLKNHLIEFFCENDKGQYLIFADLIQYTERDSKEIIKHFEEVIEPLNNYVRSLFNYLKPTAVLSANAFVSNYLVELFNAGKNATYIDIENGSNYKTRIFLASMLTGQRAMDTFSRQRLFNEMQSYIE